MNEKEGDRRKREIHTDKNKSFQIIEIAAEFMCNLVFCLRQHICRNGILLIKIIIYFKHTG